MGLHWLGVSGLQALNAVTVLLVKRTMATARVAEPPAPAKEAVSKKETVLSPSVAFTDGVHVPVLHRVGVAANWKSLIVPVLESVGGHSLTRFGIELHSAAAASVAA